MKENKYNFVAIYNFIIKNFERIYILVFSFLLASCVFSRDGIEHSRYVLILLSFFFLYKKRSNAKKLISCTPFIALFLFFAVAILSIFFNFTSLSRIDEVLNWIVIFISGYIASTMSQEKNTGFFLVIPVALVGAIIILPAITGEGWSHLNIFSGSRLDLYMEDKANHLGLICGMFSFTTAYLGAQEKGYKQIAYFLLAGACAFLLFRTGARASFLGTIIIFSGWLLWKIRNMSYKKKFIFLLFGISILGITFYSPLKDNRIITTVTSGVEHDRSFLERFFIWHVAYKNFLQRPLIGNGFDSFADQYKAEFQKREANHSYTVKYPYAIPSTNNAHNYFLHFLSETGIFGLGAMLWFWLSVITRAKSKNPAAAPVAGMFLISLIAFQMNMSMYGSQLSTILFAFAGISSYSIKKEGLSEES